MRQIVIHVLPKDWRPCVVWAWGLCNAHTFSSPAQLATIWSDRADFNIESRIWCNSGAVSLLTWWVTSLTGCWVSRHKHRRRWWLVADWEDPRTWIGGWYQQLTRLQSREEEQLRMINFEIRDIWTFVVWTTFGSPSTTDIKHHIVAAVEQTSGRSTDRNTNLPPTTPTHPSITTAPNGVSVRNNNIIISSSGQWSWMTVMTIFYGLKYIFIPLAYNMVGL